MNFMTPAFTTRSKRWKRERRLLRGKSDGVYDENDDIYPRFYQKRNKPAVIAVVTTGERGKAARHILHKWFDDSAAAVVLRGGGEGDRTARRCKCRG